MGQTQDNRNTKQKWKYFFKKYILKKKEEKKGKNIEQKSKNRNV